MFDPKAVLFTAVCSLVAAIIGAIVGAFTVHWLTRSREHEVWLRDRRTEEWRDLFKGLATASTFAVKRVVANRNAGQQLGADDATELGVAIESASFSIVNHLFIVRDLERTKVAQRWTKAVGQFIEDRDEDAFIKEYRSIRDVIIDIAMQG